MRNVDVEIDQFAALRHSVLGANVTRTHFNLPPETNEDMKWKFFASAFTLDQTIIP